MIWLFERGSEALRLETRYDNASDEYVLVVVWSDHRTETERFSEKTAFEARLQRLEERLAAEQWTQVGPPALVYDGWRLI